MIHSLPGSPAFLDEPADSPISEIALRLLVEFEGGESHVVGTATLIAGNLAVTAKHVLEDIVSRFGAQKKAAMHVEVRNYAVRLYQVLRGPVYRVWNVYFAWYCETDIALLQLGEFKRSDPRDRYRVEDPAYKIHATTGGAKGHCIWLSRVNLRSDADRKRGVSPRATR